MSVYLDFNASAPIDQRVLAYMVDVYRGAYGNADSRTHGFGENARQIVETARKEVASILNIKSDEIFFTSGATESSNLVFQGLAEYGLKSGKTHIITTAIEHKAVLGSAKYLEERGFEVSYVSPDSNGRISAAEVLQLVRENTLLVSVMHVNNETGVIQPIREIGQGLQAQGIYFHVDATQSFGKLVDELRQTPYTMLSMSAHKIGGPQGIGALVLRRNRYRLPPVKNIMYGGPQEHGLRPGTIPVALAAGLGRACALAESEYSQNWKKCANIKSQLLHLLEESGVSYRINGDAAHCMANTLNLCFPGVSSEALMLSTKQFCGVSNGSACNSNSYEPSYVLQAMGFPLERIESSIRISWGAETNPNDCQDAFRALLRAVHELAN